MTNKISEADARLALNSIERQRRQVVAEIDVPAWYWWGVALGWVALGVIADLKHPWVSLAATAAFGAIHGSIAHRVLSGRRGSPQLSVRAELVGHRLPAYVVGFLVVLVAVTIGAALAINADGADHPATIASVMVAIAIVCGGPSIVDRFRRISERNVVA